MISAGELDVASPPSAIAAAVTADDESLHHYGPPSGIPALRDALAGGVTVELRAGAERTFKIDTEMLDRAVTPKTKLLVFVSPGNPTGAVYRRRQLMIDGLRAVPGIACVEPTGAFYAFPSMHGLATLADLLGA